MGGWGRKQHPQFVRRQVGRARLKVVRRRKKGRTRGQVDEPLAKGRSDTVSVVCHHDVDMGDHGIAHYWGGKIDRGHHDAGRGDRRIAHHWGGGD